MKKAFLFFLLCGVFAIIAACNTPNFEIVKTSNACINSFKGYKYITCSKVNIKSSKVDITANPGFVTDLASIPRIFWSLLTPSRSEFMSPSIIHDYLYRCPSVLSRKEIDILFYNSLITNGVGIATSLIMFNAVRIFGGFSFKKRECYNGNVKVQKVS